MKTTSSTVLRSCSSSSSFLLLLLLFLSLSTTASALKQPTSYCKCICFQNSTIIPLNSPPPSSSSSSSAAFLLSPRSPAPAADDKPNAAASSSSAETKNSNSNSTDGARKHHALTCNDCNRAFCLDYNLPICKNAKEEDVFATCFQRDSLKDRTIVILFLLATSSLLGWALIKPFVVKTTETITNSETLGRYMPVRHALTPSEDLSSSFTPGSDSGLRGGRDPTGTTIRDNGNNTGGGSSMLPRASNGVLAGSSSGSGSGGGSVGNNGAGAAAGAGGERRFRTGGGSLSRQGGLNS